MTTENWREKYLKEAEKVEPSIVTRPVPVPPLSELPDPDYRLEGLDADGHAWRLDDIASQVLATIDHRIEDRGYWTLADFLVGVTAIAQTTAMLAGTQVIATTEATRLINAMFFGKTPPKIIAGLPMQGRILKGFLRPLALRLAAVVIRAEDRLLA